MRTANHANHAKTGSHAPPFAYFVWFAVEARTVTGNAYVPAATETFTHDADGNLTSDSLWTNVWNAENRRITIESGTGVPPVARIREQWTYLPDGRWVERIVSTNNGSSYVAMLTNRFVWDGNVLLAVLNHTNGLELAFMRGLDLSGTLQGAGGVGGLLAVQDQSTINSQPSTHFVANDGNGNVAALVNAADGTESARYEYGPFNEPLRITGVMGKVNPIRFSTQYADDFTGDTKYLYRDLRDGRWLSRDPIGERGGKNIQAINGNDLENFADANGLEIKNYQYTEKLFPGKFEVKLQGQIKFGVGDDTVDGFYLKYHRSVDPICPCPKGALKLVQAIKSPTYNIQFDTSDKVRAEHWRKGGGGRSIPKTPNPPGHNEPESVLDGPYWGGTESKGVWKIEVCAVCRKQDASGKTTDENFGCVRFDFKRDGNGNESLEIVGGKPGDKIDAKAPTEFWKAALKIWEKQAGVGQ